MKRKGWVKFGMGRSRKCVRENISSRKLLEISGAIACLSLSMCLYTSELPQIWHVAYDLVWKQSIQLTESTEIIEYPFNQSYTDLCLFFAHSHQLPPDSTTHLHVANLQWPFNLPTCKCLRGGSKPEQPEKTHPVKKCKLDADSTNGQDWTLVADTVRQWHYCLLCHCAADLLIYLPSEKFTSCCLDTAYIACVSLRIHVLVKGCNIYQSCRQSDNTALLCVPWNE